MNVNYIKRSMSGVVVSCEEGFVEYQEGLKSFINKLCFSRLVSYEGVLKATKAVFGYHKLIPIYVNKEILLFSTQSIRNLDVMFINYHQVHKIRKLKHEIEILFYDQSTLRLQIGRTFIKTQMKRCGAINNYLTKKSFESVYNYGLSIEI